jgi:glutamate racemase
VGGLTVLRAIKAVLPDLPTVYLGDTARLPYGTKTAETIAHYVRQNVAFLVRQGVDSVVVACNSASSVLNALGDLGVPMHGTILPGARAAAALTRNGRVAVLGTGATIRSGAYGRALRQLVPALQVVEQSAALLVPLVEEGWWQDEVTRQVAWRYLQPVQQAGCDTLVLGCTHFPILRELIGDLLGNQVALVDPGLALAEELRCSSGFSLLEPVGSAERKVAAKERWFCTDPHPGLLELAKAILGKEQQVSWEFADLAGEMAADLPSTP